MCIIQSHMMRGECHRDSTILQEHCAAAKALFASVVQLELDYAHAVQGLAARSAYVLHDAGTVPVISLPPPDLLAAEAKPLPRGRADRKVPATPTPSVPMCIRLHAGQRNTSRLWQSAMSCSLPARHAGGIVAWCTFSSNSGSARPRCCVEQRIEVPG